jgi:pyruvate formate lyase activating enzyme
MASEPNSPTGGRLRPAQFLSRNGERGNVNIGAFVPLSLSDHEGRVAAVVFVRGCNFRCPFCHNADLVLDLDSAASLGAEEVIARLEERRGFLDSVVVTGGEPTLQADLPLFLAEAHALGLLTKLDTNGARPDVLAGLFEKHLVDSVAMDLKAPRHRYTEFAGVPCDISAMEESIRCIRGGSADYEFRTTVAPGLDREDVVAIADWIRGARRYVLQAFRVPGEKDLLDPSWAARAALSPAELRGIWTDVASRVGGGGVRG